MLTVAAFDCETAGQGVWYLVRATVFHGRSLLVGRVRSCDFETEDVVCGRCAQKALFYRRSLALC